MGKSRISVIFLFFIFGCILHTHLIWFMLCSILVLCFMQVSTFCTFFTLKGPLKWLTCWSIMFYPQHYLVGLDISEKAIHTAIKLSSSQSNASYFTCLKAKNFTWHPTDLFDFIFDYTFFYAIKPKMRLVWAQKMKDIFKPDGELTMLMFS
ncbi:hypothetical protein UlMin_015515 [Ulmus minor]